MPIFRIPIHVSYVIYISTFSRILARNYFRFALMLCGLAGIQPSLLLHPLDFLGCDDLAELQFFPGMGLHSTTKLGLVSEVLEMFCSNFAVRTMRDHAVMVDPTLAQELSVQIASAA
jgi:hypothetical protein